MILRSQLSGPTLACFCVVVVLLAGCTREDSARATSGAMASGSAADDSASESVQIASPEQSDLPANEPSPDHSPSTNLAKLRQEALLALEAGDVEAAFDLGRQATRMAPDDPQVIFLMAMILGKRNRFPEAIQMLDELTETTPELRLPAMGQTAEWLVRFGQWSEAEKRYRTILDEIPDAVLVHRNLAQLLLRQGRRTEAAQHLAHLCQLGDVTEGELRSLLTILHPFRGDAEREEFDPIGALGNARNEISQGDWEAARQRLETLDSVEPQEAALLGRVYAHVNDFEALQDSMETASNTGERYADAWLARGAQAAQQGDHAGAVRCFAETVLRDPTDHQAYSWMSESLTELNFPKEAAEALNRAELIKQTQTLGAEMAATKVRDHDKISKLVDLLDQLHRPLEALSWRGVRVAYADATSSLSDAETQRTLEEITRDRSEVMNANQEQATRQFVLCGVDLSALPAPERGTESEP